VFILVVLVLFPLSFFSLFWTGQVVCLGVTLFLSRSLRKGYLHYYFVGSSKYGIFLELRYEFEFSEFC
jgi:hypothetical protein